MGFSVLLAGTGLADGLAAALILRGVALVTSALGGLLLLVERVAPDP